MGFDAFFLCKYRLFWALEKIFPKIHDIVDVVRVANEMKSCGEKNLSSTMCIYIHTHTHNILIYILIKPYNLEFVHEHIIIFEFDLFINQA